MIRRREIIGLLGGSMFAWPLATTAQQAAKRIGVLMPTVASDAEIQERLAALRKGLQDLGWMEGRNYRFECRWPGPDAERIRGHAGELVELAPDVIVTGSTPGALALKQLTRSIQSCLRTSRTRSATVS